jgi:hypothetical protein
MSNENHHDPVTALSEEDATGRTAEIFAEIREVMQIPLVTSIWRTLAAVDGGLETAWPPTRPLYESGQPQAVLEKLKAEANFPVPKPRSIEQLEQAGFKGRDRLSILSILNAYNRSNGLNLIALTALIANSDGSGASYAQPPSPAPWPALPPLLPKDNINAVNWDLLELILESYLPLHQDGTINRDIEELRKFAESEAPALSCLKSSTENIPREAFEMICGYVGKPPSVTRMVTVGHGVARWLEG